MKKPRGLWTDLRSSFWFVPAVIVCAAVTLALALIEADRMLAQSVRDSWPRLLGAGAAGSRGMLSTIAGSMITVAGVIFSITIVSLSLASSQYSSRVLRNFMRDRTNPKGPWRLRRHLRLLPGGPANDPRRRRGCLRAGPVRAGRRGAGFCRDRLSDLMAFARARQTTVRMECRIGEFVIEDTSLASVSEVRDADPDAVRQISAACTVDRQRTVDQDAAYGIRQLVDVALKGLSPGINDTTTAVMCVDYLTAILARLAHRELETPGRGEAGEVQVIVPRPT